MRELCSTLSLTWLNIQTSLFPWLSEELGERWKTRTETGAKFLWLILQHVLRTGFRCARNYGFLHPNSKALVNILQCLSILNPKKVQEKISLRQRPQLSCECCGGRMEMNRTRIPVIETLRLKPNRQSWVST